MDNPQKQNPPLVLVTGSAGRIGQAVVQELTRRGRPVRGFDLRPTPGITDSVVGQISDPAALDRALQGVGTLIHLAATPDDADFLNELLPNNIVGLYHVLEAARRVGVRRLILASSGQVVWWQRFQGPFPIPVDGPLSPRSWYAATKVFLEAMGRSFHEIHQHSVLVVRLGWCPRTKEQVDEIAASDWAQAVYLSPGDAGRFFAQAVEAPPIGFAITYAMSKPRQHPYYDMEPARLLLGFEPQDTWPQGIEVVVGAKPFQK